VIVAGGCSFIGIQLKIYHHFISAEISRAIICALTAEFFKFFDFNLTNTPEYIVSADFNNDNIRDVAISNTSSNNSLSILLNNGAGNFSSPFNLSPEQGASEKIYQIDYNRNGATDLVIVKAITLNKVVLLRNTCPPNKPRFDFDGDGKTDLLIFRPGPGEWWYLRSFDGGNRAFQFGASTDRLVPADYTGDGKTDVAFWRPSTGFWFVLRSEDSSFYSFPFGAAGDVPSSGDYDGDGRADAAVFRPSSQTWFAQRATAGTLIQGFGVAGDKPVPNAFVP